MSDKKGSCLLCGKPLVYFDAARKAECVFCHGVFETNALCVDGHYVCDRCHAEKGTDAIMRRCLESRSDNPAEILFGIMEDPFIYMHGPEHHIMVGAALLTAWKNAGGEGELKSMLEEMKRRGSRYPGGSCGFWGCCGAAVSAGMFFSIITKTTPLSEASWGQGNMLTSMALGEIAKTGGPRCCKRNSFSAVKTAVKFVNETLGVSMKLPDKIVCRFSSNNKECLGSRCPYNKNHTETGI